MSSPAHPSAATAPSNLRSSAVVALHVLVLSAACYWAFSRNIGALFNGIDGANMLTMVGRQYELTSPAFGFSANPLQGLSDIWFGFNAWFSPGYLIPYYLLPGLTAGDSAYQIAVYTIHVVMLFAAILVFARAAGLRILDALIGAWATVLLIFPFFGAPLVYPILQLQPNLAFSIADALLIVSVFSCLGRNGAPSLKGCLTDALSMLAMLALSMHILLLSPTVVLLSLVFMVFLGAGFLFAAASRYEFLMKVSGALLVVAALVAGGFATYLLGIFEFTAPAFFGEALESNRTRYYFVSVVFQMVHGPGGPLLALAGLAGLVQAAICADRRLALVARAALCFFALNLLFGFLTLFFDFWRGPSPVYLEAMLWPVFALFGARLAVVAVERVIGPGAREYLLSPACLAALAVAPVLLLLSSAPFAAPQSERLYIFPPSRPAMVDSLQKEIGVTAGVSPVGRVAVFDLMENDEPVGWSPLHSHAHQRMRRAGNDFSTIGLWYFGIPTLFEYSPALSPALYSAMKGLFSRPGDIQQRSVLVLRQINATALAALGIQYVITDAPADLPLVTTEETGDDETLYLYEVPGAIDGAASPTKIETVDSFDAAIDSIGRPDFDPHASAIALGADIAGQDIAELEPATDVNVSIVQERYRVTATSPGRSLLVVPVEFSRCLIWHGSGVGTPTLLRINALETGILFDGRIEGEMYYFTGPFTNSRCRREDARAFSRLLAR